LRGEPDWRAILHVEKVEFRTGTANQKSLPRCPVFPRLLGRKPRASRLVAQVLELDERDRLTRPAPPNHALSLPAPEALSEVGEC
jgi:hypothetical protein